MSEKGTFELTLEPRTHFEESLGIVDRMLRRTVEPVKLVVRLPYFSDSEVKRGGTARMISADWGGAPDEADTAKDAPAGAGDAKDGAAK